MLELNKNKIIADLCGGSGAWSKFYKEAGYDVRNITLPDYNILTWDEYLNLDIYGILFALPCTHFCGSGARWWKEKDRDGRTLEDTKILANGLMIIATCKPHFWCIENPVGRLGKWLGKPIMYFHPYEFGYENPYTKKTCLWGKFNIPEKHPTYVRMKNPIWYMSPSIDRAKLRSITPSGFAKAFYEANK